MLLSCFLSVVLLVSARDEKGYDKLFSPYMNPEYFDFGKIIHSSPNFRIVFYHQLTAGMLRDHNRLVFAHINRPGRYTFSESEQI